MLTGKVEAGSYILFNGHDIERWILKLLIGMVITANARKVGLAVEFSVPVEQVSRMVIDLGRWPRNSGMFFTHSLGDYVALGDKFGFAPIGVRETVYGCVISAMGFGFAIMLPEVPAERMPKVLGGSSTHRPGMLRFKYGSNHFNLCFSREEDFGSRPIIVAGVPPGDPTRLGAGAKPADRSRGL